MINRQDECRVLRLEMLAMLSGSAFGAWLAYGLGKTVNLTIEGRLIHLEAASAALGLIAGFTIARALLPVLVPMPDDFAEHRTARRSHKQG